MPLGLEGEAACAVSGQRRAKVQFSFRICELAHICPGESGRCCSTPEGGSQFQFPGLARSLTAYCVNGLVLYSTRLINFIEGSAQRGDLRSPEFAREFAPPILLEERER
jgi:hypothetical protein